MRKTERLRWKDEDNDDDEEEEDEDEVEEEGLKENREDDEGGKDEGDAEQEDVGDEMMRRKKVIQHVRVRVQRLLILILQLNRLPHHLVRTTEPLPLQSLSQRSLKRVQLQLLPPPLPTIEGKEVLL